MRTQMPSAVAVLLLFGLLGTTASAVGASEEAADETDPVQPIVEIHSRLDHSTALFEGAAGPESNRDVTVRFRNPGSTKLELGSKTTYGTD